MPFDAEMEKELKALLKNLRVYEKEKSILSH